MATNSDRTISIQPLRSPVPGRVRFHVSELYRSDELASWLQLGLGQIRGVIAVQANPLTGNVLVIYHPEQFPTLDHLTSSIWDTARTWSDTMRVLRGAKKRVADSNLQWHSMDLAEVAKKTGTSTEKGLKPKAVRAQRKKFGFNSVSQNRPRSQSSVFLGQFKNLPSQLLIASAGISFITGGIADAAVIAVVLLLNGYIGFKMETDSDKIIRSIIGSTASKIKVRRGGKWNLIEASEVVVGDLFELSPGVVVPADGRMIQCRDLSVDESILTGESLPVFKKSETLRRSDLSLGDRKNMVFRGTVVTGGTGIALTVAVGVQSETGKIQRLLETSVQPMTQLQKQLGHLGNQMSVIAILASGSMLALGIWRRQSFLQVLKGALSMTVAAIPESLPTVATMTLANGLKNLRDQGVIVRNLGAIETLAAIDHVCLDKTGTLTMNDMVVDSISTLSAQVRIHEGLPETDPALKKVLWIAALCNFNSSSTENALLKVAAAAGFDSNQVQKDYPVLFVNHRTEKQPYMETTHRTPDGKTIIAIKGSPAAVSQLCHSYQKNQRYFRLGKETRKRIEDENNRLAALGHRVLGFAYRPNGKANGNGRTIWLGLVSMTDPIRKGMKDLIPLFQQVGIRSSMITGDQAATAKAIGKKLGIEKIYSRVSPGEKLGIIQKLQNSNHLVAMIGDGINDGPALKSANVGIAMAARGSETAAQAADIILQNDNILALIEAVRESRTIHHQIQKAADYAVAKNLSEIFFTLGASALWRSDPLSPFQFLWINLITDTFPELALARERNPVVGKSESEQSPSHFREKLITRDTGRRILFDAFCLSIAPYAGYFIGRRSGNGNASSLAFLTMAGSSLLYTLNARSTEHTVLHYDQLPKNPYVFGAIGAGVVLQGVSSVIPFLRATLGLQKISRTGLMTSAIYSIAPFAAIEFKKWAVRIK